MKYIIGRKVGMVELFDVNGNLLPTTVIQCAPNLVLDTKSQQKILVGYNPIPPKKINQKLNKPLQGIYKKLNAKPCELMVEFDHTTTNYQKGDQIKVDIFEKGEVIDVQAITKGRGYTGAVVRWNYKIGPMSHGAGYPHRYQGSISFGRGGSQGQRVPKGKKMAGQYGHETVTIQNLVVLEPIAKWNILLIKGAIPGPKNGLVLLKSSVKKPDKKVPIVIISKEIQEDILRANEALEDREALHEANVAAEAAEKAAEEKKAQEALQKAAEAKKEEERAAAKATNEQKK